MASKTSSQSTQSHSTETTTHLPQVGVMATSISGTAATRKGFVNSIVTPHPSQVCPLQMMVLFWRSLQVTCMNRTRLQTTFPKMLFTSDMCPIKKRNLNKHLPGEKITAIFPVGTVNHFQYKKHKTNSLFLIFL